MHFINKEWHFKFARILSKYHLLPLPKGSQNRCGFSNLCSCSWPSHGRRWVSNPCLFLLFTPLLETIRRRHLLRTSNRPHTRFLPSSTVHSIEPSNQFTVETESEGQLNMEPWEIHWHNRLQKTNTHKQVPRLQYGGNVDRSMHLTDDMHLQQMRLTTSRYSMSLYTLHRSVCMTLLSTIHCI